MSDRLARRLASMALAVALLALALAGYSVVQGQRYLDDVRALGEALQSQTPAPSSSLGPPLQLDVD